MMWGHSTRIERPTTLRRSFARSMGPLVGLAGFALVFLMISAFLPIGEAPPVGREVSEPGRPATTRVEALVREHECWTGEAPTDMEGKVPGHVIVTRPGDDGPVVGGEVLVGRALEHVFEGRHPRLRVHAFCR